MVWVRLGWCASTVCLILLLGLSSMVSVVGLLFGVVYWVIFVRLVIGLLCLFLRFLLVR